MSGTSVCAPVAEPCSSWTTSYSPATSVSATYGAMAAWRARSDGSSSALSWPARSSLTSKRPKLMTTSGSLMSRMM